LKAVTNSYSKHFIALTSLFVLGNGVITAPISNADKYNFLGFLVACVISVAVYYLCLILPINRLTVMGIWALALYCIADAFITFIRFISQNLLPDTKPFLIALPLILLLLYIGFQKEEMLFKFSLVSFFAAASVVLFFFFSTAKDFNVSNIFINRLPSFNGFLVQLAPYLKSIVLPTVLLCIFARLNNIRNSVSVWGLAVGFILFGLTILNSVLLFGIELSGVLDYPYSSAGSTVTFGNLFTRMDGFLYFVYLASTIVKCGVGIFTIKKSRERLFP